MRTTRRWTMTPSTTAPWKVRRRARVLACRSDCWSQEGAVIGWLLATMSPVFPEVEILHCSVSPNITSSFFSLTRLRFVCWLIVTIIHSLAYVGDEEDGADGMQEDGGR
jgi:hypothetical protein